MARICPCCVGAGVIEDGPPVRLTKTQARIWDVVRRCPDGIAIDALAQRVYAHRDDGGPECAEKVVQVMIHFANKKLRTVGQVIKGCSGSGASSYKLHRI